LIEAGPAYPRTIVPIGVGGQADDPAFAPCGKVLGKQAEALVDGMPVACGEDVASGDQVVDLCQIAVGTQVKIGAARRMG
jgi:hypothetical protein